MNTYGSKEVHSLALGIMPLICNMGTNQKMSECQMTNIKQEGGSILHVTDALQG